MKMILKILLVLIAALVLIYLLGPKPSRPVLNNDLPTVVSDLNLLEMQVLDREKSLKLRPDNEARFIWANDSLKEPTEYAMLYLHGFSACWYEGYPVNTGFARDFGCNAFFARLASHGLDSLDAMADMTPNRLWESAKEALQIARRLGHKVVIFGTSTGATLALKLAAEFPDAVHGMVLYSPNIRINNSAAFLTSRQWGLQMARQISGGNYRILKAEPDSSWCRYWYCKYRVEGVVYLQQMLDVMARKQVFERVTRPLFMGYYYKDEENQDKTVRVDAMLKMFDQLGTPAGLKHKQAFPDAGDHVIANEYWSKSVEEVRAATYRFAEDVLGMKRRRD